MTQLHVRIGIQSVRSPQYVTEVDVVAQVRKQCDQLKRSLQDIFNQFEDVSPEIMVEALKPTMELAKHYTPEQTGALKNSAYLEVTEFRGNPRVELGFARGGNPRYAPLVHEQVWVKHRAPTRSKFLEAAMNEDMDNIFARVEEGYRRFMGA